VVVDADDKLIVSLEDGRILRVDPESGAEDLLAETKGRPLGLELLDDGRVIVCDSYKGLLRLDPDRKELETLVQSLDGQPLRFCSNATAQRDGTIWFTESSDRFQFEHYIGALLEHRAGGRVFRRDPDGTVEVVTRDLYFTNGITLTEDEGALLFAETAAYRISRMALRGANAGEVEVILDNMPAFPDNLSRMRDGRTWVALPSARDRRLDLLANGPPVLRKVLWSAPEFLRRAGRTTWMMAIDEHGSVLVDLQEPRRDYRHVTGVAEHKEKLYLTSILESGILEVDLPRTPALK
jgi:sugar lactone lactonase YvrE